MFNRSKNFLSKPPKESLYSKLNDYSSGYDNFLSNSESGDSKMDITNDCQISSNELPDYLFPNKFRYCGNSLKKNSSRPPIISLDDNDIFDDKKKKVTFSETNTLTKSSTTPVTSQNQNNTLNHEVLSDEKYWVLVFGFNDHNRKEVLEKLKVYGNLVKVTQRKDCTFLHAKFSNINSARRAIEAGNFFINNNVLIGMQQCINLDFLETESELTEELPQLIVNKSKFNTPLADCRKFNNQESSESEVSMFQKIINFLLY
ncbi:RNA-recognition motif (RRM) Nup35-type domain-containing protein [Strongyloides ratti]|uniref:Nucleoporin NUP35 n=1 Tax=Strongyloides ratti TaxID=34506 RepID=A0A090L212_STRRB|nr:RNA-recognition motif (RRM) Nup35-type domain-containing protein [Strongyloides ratti]CEF63851.1 RNA-recognition motif (RRM) Nup35-type domain-containing protein [Strongyloides ratti]